MAWLGDTVPCRCGWVADPTEENGSTAICGKCGAVYEHKSYGWVQKTKSFEERMRNEN